MPLCVQVLQAVLSQYGVPEPLFAPVCVVVDKLDKLPREEVASELAKLGVPEETVNSA